MLLVSYSYNEKYLVFLLIFNYKSLSAYVKGISDILYQLNNERSLLARPALQIYCGSSFISSVFIKATFLIIIRTCENFAQGKLKSQHNVFLNLQRIMTGIIQVGLTIVTECCCGIFNYRSASSSLSSLPFFFWYSVDAAFFCFDKQHP